MCEYGHYQKVSVLVPADLSYTKKSRWAYKKIDSCIAGLVRALQLGEIYTRGCCCGHGKSDGEIRLQDGRVLIIRRKNG